MFDYNLMPNLNELDAVLHQDPVIEELKDHLDSLPEAADAFDYDNGFDLEIGDG